MNRSVAGILVVAGIGGLGYAVFSRSPSLSHSGAPSFPNPNVASAQRMPAKIQPQVVPDPKLAALWREFQDQFGDELSPTFYKGRLVMIEGHSGRGNGAPGFSPQDSQAAIRRAKEILRAVGPLLGLKSVLPLSHPIAHGSEASAQVYFQETFQSRPISPGGLVTVDLGSEGELIGLHADYLPELRVENNVSLSADEAQTNVPAGFPGESRQGKAMIWVSDNTGRFAYNFYSRGYQYVVDAQSGAVLSRKDRRQF